MHQVPIVFVYMCGINVVQKICLNMNMLFKIILSKKYDTELLYSRIVSILTE